MIADQDIKEQVERALGTSVGDYDTDAIAGEIMRNYGRVDIDDIPSDEFWEIVACHDRSRP